MTDWTNVIELICDKLGIVVNSAMDLIPEIVRYNTVINGIEMSLSILATLIGVLSIVWGFKWALKKAKTENDDDDWLYYSNHLEFAVSVTVGFILAVFGLIFFMIFMPEFVGWFVSPNVKAIEWAMELIKQGR